MFSRIYRCSDGYIFTADWGRLVVASFHFGASKFLRCPVDHRWRMARPVGRADLTGEQLTRATQYKF